MSDSKKFLIIGSGQIGRALSMQLGQQASVLSRSECDFLTATQADFEQLIAAHQPSAVLNAAAYTAVDAAESEEGRAAAFRINGEAPGYLAAAAKKHRIPLVHYSTDYVFNGEGSDAWKESDTPAPHNAYGNSKLAGERAVISAGGDHLIFRISWVFDETGKNFLNTMLRLGSEREALKVVADQIGSPCYAGDIAEATLASLSQALAKPIFPSGIYHMCNQGEISWHGFAEAIFEEALPHAPNLLIKYIQPITTQEYPTPAKRPLNSRLNCEKLRTTFNIVMPHWRDALKRCLKNKYAH